MNKTKLWCNQSRQIPAPTTRPTDEPRAGGYRRVIRELEVLPHKKSTFPRNEQRVAGQFPGAAVKSLPIKRVLWFKGETDPGLNECLDAQVEMGARHCGGRVSSRPLSNRTAAGQMKQLGAIKAFTDGGASFAAGSLRFLSIPRQG